MGVDSQRPSESATVPQKAGVQKQQMTKTPYADRKQVLIVTLIVLRKFPKE